MVIRLLGRRRRNERGQALVEFALVMPILLLLVMGIFDFGRAWNLHQTITHAAREGARQAAMFNATVTEADVEQTVKAAIATSGFDSDLASVTIQNFKAGRPTLVQVNVAMPYRFGFLAPFAKLALTDGNAVLTLRTYARYLNE